MTFLRAEDAYCYRWGTFGRWLGWGLPWYPVWLWVALTARGFNGSKVQRVYYMLQFLSFAFATLQHYVLRDGVFRKEVPHSQCTTVRFSMPALETAMLAHYMVAVTLHCRYFDWPYGGMSWISFVFTVLTVYGGSSVLGNYTQADLLVGVAVGVLNGLVHGYVIFALLFPNQVFLHSWWWLWWDPHKGYRHASLYATAEPDRQSTLDAEHIPGARAWALTS